MYAPRSAILHPGSRNPPWGRVDLRLYGVHRRIDHVGGVDAGVKVVVTYGEQFVDLLVSGILDRRQVSVVASLCDVQSRPVCLAARRPSQLEYTHLATANANWADLPTERVDVGRWHDVRVIVAWHAANTGSVRVSAWAVISVASICRTCRLGQHETAHEHHKYTYDTSQ